uniref:Vitellogenin n=1 Tax=Romanomermis culicivorax TaxID=13658 RepID=A0A915IS36_ROMCU
NHEEIGGQKKDLQQREWEKSAFLKNDVYQIPVGTLTMNARNIKLELYSKDKQGILMQQSKVI